MKSIILASLVIVSLITLNAQQMQEQSMKLGKSPTEITVEVEINAPIEKVWAEFANIGNIYLNSPTVAKSRISSENKTGIGATRHMEMSEIIKEGATFDERVIEWEEGTYQKVEVYKMYKVPGIQTTTADFRLIEKEDKTVLRSSINYSMKNGLYGFINNLMGKKKFAKVWKSVIAGYKYHIETGEEVTEKTNLNLDAVKLISINKVK